MIFLLALALSTQCLAAPADDLIGKWFDTEYPGHTYLQFYKSGLVNFMAEGAKISALYTIAEGSTLSFSGGFDGDCRFQRSKDEAGETLKFGPEEGCPFSNGTFLKGK